MKLAIDPTLNSSTLLHIHNASSHGFFCYVLSFHRDFYPVTLLVPKGSSPQSLDTSQLNGRSFFLRQTTGENVSAKCRASCCVSCSLQRKLKIPTDNRHSWWTLIPPHIHSIPTIPNLPISTGPGKHPTPQNGLNFENKFESISVVFLSVLNFVAASTNKKENNR